jgi:glycosyltransferase involved in cell wall biosynthesis
MVQGRMLRVAVVSTVLPDTNACADLTQALQKVSTSGVKICCFADKNPGNLQVPLANLELVWHKDWRYPFEIAAATIRHRPHIVHVHHEFTMYGPPITAILFPVLLLLLKMLRTRIVLTIHAVVPYESVNDDFLRTFQPESCLPASVMKLAFFFIYRSCALLADSIIVHSPGLACHLIAGYRVDASKVHVLPHGVRVPPEERTERMPDADWAKRLIGRKFILNFGYLTARKGLTFLFESFAKLAPRYPEWDLVVAGGTLQQSYAHELNSLVTKLQIAERVLFTSFVNSDELDYLFRTADIVALPATYSISASGPLSLAIAYLKPVVANSIGVFAEDLVHEQDALLCPPGSSAALAASLERLMQDARLRERLVLGMRRRRAGRTWKRVAEQTLVVYQRTLRQDTSLANASLLG